LEDNFSVTISSSWGASVVRELVNTSQWNRANDWYWDSVVPHLFSSLRVGDVVFMINDMAGFSPQMTTEGSRNTLEILRRGIESLSINLGNKGIKLVVLNGNPLTREANCEPALAVKQWFAPFGGSCKFVSKAETLRRRVDLDNVLKRLESERRIAVVDLMDVFCPGDVCDYQSTNGEVLYRDVWSHPSVEGARLSAPVIRKVLDLAATRIPI
jgi:hypothetical protein